MEIRVEELSRSTGVAVDTIRYYQRRRLLPGPERRGRVAVYDDTHVERLAQIRRLAEQGFTLDQIGRLLDDERNDELLGALVEVTGSPELTREELAARADVPPTVVDLAVGFGLVRPVEGAEGERFDPAAVEMLRLARELVSAGVPIDRLLDLAERHARHIDDIVDRAVALFREQVARPRDDAEAAEMVRRLVPGVTQLVAEHFRQTLRARAGALLVTPDLEGLLAVAHDRAAATGRTQYVSADLPAPDGLDPLVLMTVDSFGPRHAWCHPDAGVTVAGLGVAAVADGRPGGDGTRGSALGSALADLRAVLHATPGARPRLLGGMAFFDAEPGPPWQAFGPARFVLPELVVERRRGELVATATVAVGPDDAPAALRERVVHLERLLDTVPVDGAGAGTARVGGALAEPGSTGSHDDALGAPAADARSEYPALVERALGEIAAGRIQKVVVARSELVPRHPDLFSLLDDLRTDRPGCATFAVEAGDSVFVGSTPELLVRRMATEVTSMALAGTGARGSDDDADRIARQALLDDPKEQAEHRFVVDALRDRLVGAGVRLDPPAPTSTLDLPGLRHLVTPVVGHQSVDGPTVLELAGVLHPTPAVSGTPLGTARAWLADHEGLERGWYAGPVGVVDLEGDGELWVALRSALVSPDGTRLYAGAGIVDGSRPERELAETDLKLVAMRQAVQRAAGEPDR